MKSLVTRIALGLAVIGMFAACAPDTKSPSTPNPAGPGGGQGQGGPGGGGNDRREQRPERGGQGGGSNLPGAGSIPGGLGLQGACTHTGGGQDVTVCLEVFSNLVTPDEVKGVCAQNNLAAVANCGPGPFLVTCMMKPGEKDVYMLQKTTAPVAVKADAEKACRDHGGQVL